MAGVPVGALAVGSGGLVGMLVIGVAGPADGAGW